MFDDLQSLPTSARLCTDGYPVLVKFTVYPSAAPVAIAGILRCCALRRCWHKHTPRT